MTEAELDTRGLQCPLPMLKARKCLDALPVGGVLRLLASDPMAVIDVPHFCSEQGHELLGHESRDGCYIFRIRRK